MDAAREPSEQAMARRQALGLSVDNVASRLAIEGDLYLSFEAGHPVLGVADLRKLAEVLEMRVDELLFGDDPKHVLLRADDSADAAEAVETSDELIQEYLFLEALVGQ
jgi:transcriptional regulator with XRE-family HTH domain